MASFAHALCIPRSLATQLSTVILSLCPSVTPPSRSHMKPALVCGKTRLLYLLCFHLYYSQELLSLSVFQIGAGAQHSPIAQMSLR